MCIPKMKLSRDDVTKWNHFRRYWPFVRGIHRPPVNSPHKGQWRGALMFSLIYVCIDGWANNREDGDLRRYHTHYYVTVMTKMISGLSRTVPSSWAGMTRKRVNKLRYISDNCFLCVNFIHLSCFVWNQFFSDFRSLNRLRVDSIHAKNLGDVITTGSKSTKTVTTGR